MREAAPEEAAGEGTAAGGAAERLRLRPAAPGRRVLAEAAEVSGFNAQRLRGVGGRALRRRDAANAVTPGGAGPGHPPSPRRPGGERRTAPTSTLS